MRAEHSPHLGTQQRTKKTLPQSAMLRLWQRDLLDLLMQVFGKGLQRFRL